MDRPLIIVSLLALTACDPTVSESEGADSTTSGADSTGAAPGSSTTADPDPGSTSGVSTTNADGSSSRGSSTSAGDTSTGEAGSSTGAAGSSSSSGESSSSTGEEVCGGPDPVVCDGDDDDPWHALGLNCPEGPQVETSVFGQAQQLYVHQGNFGTSDAFPPREGEKFVILSSGIAEQMVTQVGGTVSTPNDGGNLGDLPPPMTRTQVSETETCTENPALVGTGDCSNTIEVQYEQGGVANDLAYMRLSAEVPENTFGFTYDFAFFSVEYPDFYQTQYNDMYVAWLESEGWTGNISYDASGTPISLNGSFLDLKDAPNPFDCPEPCQAPELAGTAAQGHAGTPWLTSSAPVVPGETIELYFTIFDLADTALDSAVILDNWRWTCDGAPPITAIIE